MSETVFPSPDHLFDVVIVGGGPSGSATAYWLAQSGWDVCLVEKKTFPREKTCGDGLTPRSVYQLAQMGLEDAVSANGHKYYGLRSFGFGEKVEMKWPEHPTFPNYGYSITRFSLDGLVADHAASSGATVLQGAEAVGLIDPTPGRNDELKGCSGILVKDKYSDAVHEIRGRVVVSADGQNSRIGRELGVTRRKDWPMGLALRGYYRSERHAEDYIESHLDIRSPEGDVVPGYGWIFPLGDGRVNVGVGLLSTDRAWKGVNTTKLQEYFVAQTAEAWGFNDETSCGPATGGRLPMGLALGPRVGANTLTVGDATGTINPFNGEGIAYGYESGRLAASVIGHALLANDLSGLRDYNTQLDAAYGEYYKVARAFVRIISEPEILALCVKLGLKIPPLMRELLKLMANLMSNDRKGPMEYGYAGLARLVDVIPEQAFNAIFAD